MHPKADVNNDTTFLIASLLNAMGNKHMRSFHFKRLVLITLEEINVRKLYKFQIILEICVIVIPRFIESLKPFSYLDWPTHFLKVSQEVLFILFKSD